MKKSLWVLLILALAIVIGFWIGTYLYNVEENENQHQNNVETIEFNNFVNNTNIKEIETSVMEEKISINTEVVEEIYYVNCDHLIKTKINNTKHFINMTKEELKQEYIDWEIREFNIEKVILYKEEQSYCNQHYILKDLNGFVTIYNMDESDNINEIIEITEIETKYLPEQDRKRLKNGIKVYTIQNLNKLIENFE